MQGQFHLFSWNFIETFNFSTDFGVYVSSKFDNLIEKPKFFGIFHVKIHKNLIKVDFYEGKYF